MHEDIRAGIGQNLARPSCGVRVDAAVQHGSMAIANEWRLDICMIALGCA